MKNICLLLLIFFGIKNDAVSQELKWETSFSPKVSRFLGVRDNAVPLQYDNLTGYGGDFGVSLYTRLNQFLVIRPALNYAYDYYGLISNLTFEDQIDVNFGTLTKQEISTHKLEVPLHFLGKKEEQPFGLVIGVNSVMSISVKNTQTFSGRSIQTEFETRTYELNFLLAPYLGGHFAFELANDRLIIIEPFSKVYLSKLNNFSNLMNIGLRVGVMY